MNAYTLFLALWLFALPWVLRAEELPVVFARSGRNVTFPVGDENGQPKRVGLRTLGRRWSETVTVKNGTAEFVAPKVRVPVVFLLIAEGNREPVLGEVVVYPAQSLPWDENTRLVAVGAPHWFDTWSEAVGLPVDKLEERKALKARDWGTPEKPALLILGRQAARGGITAVHRLTAERAINVLVLETDWFGMNETDSRDIVLSPKHMTGPLADLQSQRWALPPAFRQRVPCVANRQTWIAGPEYPLVEEIRSPQPGTESLRTVFSYLPWQQQLGRTEMADELFLRLLSETAKGADNRPPQDGRWRLLFPDTKDVKADERPVLAAALKSVEVEVNFRGERESREVHAFVLDLRGKRSPPSGFFEKSGLIRRIESRIGPDSPLLILGDDPSLYSWKWLQSDGRGRRSSTTASSRYPPGVIWWPEESRPPSMESQLRLMQLFSEWNISLLEPFFTGTLPGR